MGTPNNSMYKYSDFNLDSFPCWILNPTVWLVDITAGSLYQKRFF